MQTGRAINASTKLMVGERQSLSKPAPVNGVIRPLGHFSHAASEAAPVSGLYVLVGHAKHDVDALFGV